MSVQLLIGPMYAGKTSELFRRIRRYQIGGRRCIVLRYYKDTRYVSDESTELASSHDGVQMKAVPVKEPWEAKEMCMRANVIGIDEGQFMGDDLVNFCTYFANPPYSKHIIISALNGTSEQVPFPNIPPLMAIADDISMFTSICTLCNTRDAPFTRRIDQGPHSIQDVGGSDKYAACCRQCLGNK